MTCHIPVLLDQVVSSLRAEQGGSFLDCTFGGGGHAVAILEANSENRILGIDRDKRAVERGKEKIASYGPRARLCQSTFAELKSVAEGQKFDGAIADLGTSSDQLAEQRGFSFKDDTPLDMRMDEDHSTSAHEIVNEYSEQQLIEVLRGGGVSKNASIIARAIVGARPIFKTNELARVINQALVGRTSAQKRTNPATTAFQAIRIAVNREYEEIEALLDLAPSLIKASGRLAVVTFHSGEDKLIARRMKSWEGESMPALWPGPRSDGGIGKLVARRPIVPDEREIARNPRSRSARLRVFEFSEGLPGEE